MPAVSVMRATGSDDDRLQLLNLMEHLLGPAALGDNPEENMPYRHGRRLPELMPPLGHGPAPDDDQDDEPDDEPVDDARAPG
jgi:hypothetical protein